jgi:L-fuculose-phosphate aldolase
MRNHGVAVAGRSIDEAVVLALVLEDACKIQLMTEAAGGVGECFSDEDIQRLHDTVTRPEQFSVNFEFLRRKVQRSFAAC